MTRRWWLVPLAGAAGLVAYREWIRGRFGPVPPRMQSCDMPSAPVYDSFSGLLVGGMYQKVALESIDACPAGRMLDVGCGPGRLDVMLGVMSPSLDVVGVDIEPSMIERATKRAEEAGISGRVHFEVGDVGAMSFGDGEFDLVISTLSMHHWPDPLKGLAEVHRVLKPGSEARIYDVPDRFRQFFHGGATMAELAAASPFKGGTVEVFRWPGQIPALRCLRLRRTDAMS